MRILFIQRHFWPDVPTYAHITKEIATHLALDGHDVTVLAATPTYNAAYTGPRPPAEETVDGISILRIEMLLEGDRRTHRRMVDTARFLGHVIRHLFRHRRDYDLLFVTNAPPVVAAATVRLVSKMTQRPYVYHLQDLQPEASVVSGVMADRGMARFLCRIDRKNCAAAEAVVVLSADMADSLANRGLSRDSIHIINNPIIETAPEAAPTDTGSRGETRAFRVVFSGNMGRFQGLDRVVAAAHLIADHRDIEFVFVGSGAEMEALEQQAGSLTDSTVRFVRQLPLPEVMGLLSVSHIGLVALKPGMYRFAYPSKTMAYVESGCRILLLMEQTSELATVLNRLDLGTCVETSDPQSIADAILAEHARSRQSPQPRENIQEIGRALFGSEAILPKWSALVDTIEAEHISPEEPDEHNRVVGLPLTVRQVSRSDIEAVVSIHTAAFPGFTTTKLGPRFLTEYYRIVLGLDERIFLLAEDQHGHALGFVAGFMSPPSFYSVFRKRRLRLAWAAAPALVRHPRLVADSRGGAQWANTQADIGGADWCELASVAVQPDARSVGIGSALTRRFAETSFEKGAAFISLATDAEDNATVRFFYERLGFQQHGSLRRGQDRDMVEYRLYPGDHDA